jgi:hypothetical protein
VNDHAAEPLSHFAADKTVCDRVHEIIGERATSDGVEAAMEACAGALQAVFAYMVVTFGSAEAAQIINQCAGQYFARLDRARN